MNFNASKMTPMFDLSNMTKNEIERQLYKEIIFYEEDLSRLSKLMVNELPRKYIMRIISKMYRLRIK